MNTTFESIKTQTIEIVSEYGLKLVGAIAVWIIGTMIVKSMVNGFDKVLDKSKTDPSLKPFLKSIVGVLLKALSIQ